MRLFVAMIIIMLGSSAFAASCGPGSPGWDGVGCSGQPGKTALPREPVDPIPDGTPPRPSCTPGSPGWNGSGCDGAKGADGAVYPYLEEEPPLYSKLMRRSRLVI